DVCSSDLGASFTTPSISETTTYYVAAQQGAVTANYGRISPVSGSGTNLSTYTQVFTLTEEVTLNSVDVISTTGTAITISLFNAGGTTQLQTTGSRTVPTNTRSTVALGWTLAPGTYRLGMTGMTGDFIRENSNVTYPFALGTFGQVTGFTSSITGSLTTSASYYFAYGWNISTGCQSGRTAVVATVTDAPALALSADSAAICAGASTETITLTGAENFDTFSWSPTTGVSGDAATGFVFNPTATTTYTLTATNADGCATVADIEVTVNPNPGTPVITASSNSVCIGEAQMLTTNIPTVGLAILGTGTTSPGTTSYPH